MTAEELCKMAQRNEPMPNGLSLSEQFLFGTIRNIYAAYRAGTITAEQGKCEKNLALGEFESMKLWERVFREQAKRSVELGKILAKANKEGCEVCRQMAGLLTGIIPSEIDCTRMICKECRSGMRLDTKDRHFKGNYDNYWICDNCLTSCIEEVRFSQSFKEIWHSENNGEVKDYEIKHEIDCTKEEKEEE